MNHGPVGSAAPTARSNGLFAALDLGTNNCRLLVGAPTRDGFRVVDSFSRIVRLGEGMHATGRLSEPAMLRAIDALHHCVARVARRPMRAVRAVATEACRQAVNGPEFLARVCAETGLRLHVISTREEVLLALESCAPLMARTARRALLFDIGGGSTELAWIRLDGPGRTPELIGTTSLPVGVVSLSEQHQQRGYTEPAYNAMVAEIARRLEPFERTHRIAQEIRQGGVQRLGTSGTVTTLAGIALNLDRYRRPLVDGVTLSSAAAGHAVTLLRGLGRDGLARHPCVGPERAEFVLPGCAIYQAIAETWPMAEVTVADRGLREGMLLQMMRHSQSSHTQSIGTPTNIPAPLAAVPA